MWCVQRSMLQQLKWWQPANKGCSQCFGYHEDTCVLCCLLQVWAGCKRGGVVYVWGVPVPARFSWVPALALVRRHEISMHSLSLGRQCAAA